MKPFEAQRTLETSGLVKTVDYHIDPKNIQHITQILRDMYSKPELAVIREYSANATDAHVMAGIPDQPIEVHLPTSMNPTLVIRDFGRGLSEAEAHELLYGYGASGKGKREGILADQTIGGFGIGCKSAFAVADQFTYTIWHEGEKQIWHCFLNEHDASQAALLSKEKSDGVSGVEVKIPVSRDNVQAYTGYAYEAYRFYAVKPNVVNWKKDEPGDPAHTEVVLEGTLDHGNVVWKFMPGISNSYEHLSIVVMGGIGYPFSPIDAGVSKDSYLYGRKFPYTNLVLVCPIGYFPIAPDRESIQFSAHAKSTMATLFKELMPHGIVKEALTKIELMPEGWPRQAVSGSVLRDMDDKITDDARLKAFREVPMIPYEWDTKAGKLEAKNIQYPRNYGRRRRFMIKSPDAGTTKSGISIHHESRLVLFTTDTMAQAAQRLQYAKDQGVMEPEDKVHYERVLFGSEAALAELQASNKASDLWIKNAPVDIGEVKYAKPPKTVRVKNANGNVAGSFSNLSVRNRTLLLLQRSPLDAGSPGVASQWWKSAAAEKVEPSTTKENVFVFVEDKFRIDLKKVGLVIGELLDDSVRKELTELETVNPRALVTYGITGLEKEVANHKTKAFESLVPPDIIFGVPTGTKNLDGFITLGDWMNKQLEALAPLDSNAYKSWYRYSRCCSRWGSSGVEAYGWAGNNEEDLGSLFETLSPYAEQFEDPELKEFLFDLRKWQVFDIGHRPVVEYFVRSNNILWPAKAMNNWGKLKANYVTLRERELLFPAKYALLPRLCPNTGLMVPDSLKLGNHERFIKCSDDDEVMRGTPTSRRKKGDKAEDRIWIQQVIEYFNHEYKLRVGGV